MRNKTTLLAFALISAPLVLAVEQQCPRSTNCGWDTLSAYSTPQISVMCVSSEATDSEDLFTSLLSLLNECTEPVPTTIQLQWRSKSMNRFRMVHASL